MSPETPTTAPAPNNGLAPPPAAPAPPEPPVVIPTRLASVLLRIALRTELGQAYWGGFITSLLDERPWLGNDPNTLVFRVPDSEVEPIPPETLARMQADAQQAQPAQRR